MNPQRLVAAIAALAIGFGVTLVGVNLDDGDDVVVTADPDAAVVDDEIVVEADDAGERIEPAEQEEEQADEPEPAEVEAPAPTEPSPQSQEAPSNSGEPSPATSEPMQPMEVEEIDDIGGAGLPRVGPACLDVVILPVASGPMSFVLVAFESDSVVVLLGADGSRRVRLPDGFDLDPVPRIVTFADDLPIEFGALCDAGDSFDEGDDPFAEDGEGLDGSIVPCDGIDLVGGAVDISDALSPRYGEVLSPTDLSDLDAYRFLVAAVTDRAAAGSFPAFLDAVEVTTSEFRSDCPFDIDSFANFDVIIELFIDDDLSADGYDEVLCNLGQLSGDSRLIDFLDREAQAFDNIRCGYAEEA